MQKRIEHNLFRKIPRVEGKVLAATRINIKGKGSFTYQYGDWFFEDGRKVNEPKLRAELDGHLPKEYRRLF